MALTNFYFIKSFYYYTQDEIDLFLRLGLSKHVIESRYI